MVSLVAYVACILAIILNRCIHCTSSLLLCFSTRHSYNSSFCCIFLSLLIFHWNSFHHCLVLENHIFWFSFSFLHPKKHCTLPKARKVPNLHWLNDEDKSDIIFYLNKAFLKQFFILFLIHNDISLFLSLIPRGGVVVIVSLSEYRFWKLASKIKICLTTVYCKFSLFLFALLLISKN